MTKNTMSRLLVHWLLMPVVSMGVACGDSMPTPPAAPASPQVSITLVSANASTVSVSDAVVCAGDWTTCPKGSQPQGPSAGLGLVRQYTLAPGTYRVTGVLEAGTSAGASVQVRIGGGTVGALGFVAFSGQPEPPPSVVTEACGGRFLTAGTGTLEWSVTFRVTDPTSRDPLCQ